MSRTSVQDVAILGRGSHGHPRRGACLMELATTIGGGRWTDHPDAADSVLAALARSINDLSNPAARRALTRFAPWLATGRQPHPQPHSSSIAALAGRAALAHTTAQTAARLAPAVSELHLPPPDGRLRRLRGWRRQRHAIHVAKAAVRILSRQSDADRMLARLLYDAINLSRTGEGLQAVPAHALDDACAFPQTLPVRVDLRIPDGSESAYYHCTAMLEQWPTSLAQACAERLSELDTTTPDLPAPVKLAPKSLQRGQTP